MPSNWRGISYVEYTDREMPFASPIESFANDASTAERIWDQISWLYRGAAKQIILGYPLVKPTGLTAPFPIAYISRQTPLCHPDYFGLTSGKPFLYCTKINRIEGWSTQAWIQAQGGNLKNTSSGDGNDTPLYQFARMHLGFETLLYDILEDSDPNISQNFGSGSFPNEACCTRYVTKLYGLSSDYITLGNGVMYFAAGDAAGSTINFTAGKILVNFDLAYRWELVPQHGIPSSTVNPNIPANLAAIENSLGKVNNSAFPHDTSESGGFAAGTLLLMGCLITPIRSAIGDRLYMVEYHFKFFQPGHHKVYGPLAKGPPVINGFVEISSDGAAHVINAATPDGVHIYDVANFDALFQPALTS